MISKKMMSYAQTLKSGTAKAQAYNIALLLKSVGSDYSIAQMMLDDHVTISHSLRQSKLLVDAGLAHHISSQPGFYGEFHFIDGSVLSSSGVDSNKVILK